MAIDSSMNILVVDDYKTMVRIIRNMLLEMGFENIEDAANGEAALGLSLAKRFDLILSDWNMAPMNGLEFLTEIRKSELNSTTPFIMVTAEAKTDNILAARKAGVSNYIIKPFTVAVLKQKLLSVLGNS